MNRTAATWPGARPRAFSSHWLVPTMLVLGAGVLSLLAVIASNGNAIAGILPIIAAVVAWRIAVAPVRNTLFVLFFLGLAIDRPGDGNGMMWYSPFVGIGGLLMHNMGNIIPIDVLKFSGLVFFLVVLLLIRAHRVLLGRVVDTPGCVVAAPPLNWSLGVSLMFVVALVMWGLVNGGNSQMAKVQVQVLVPILGMAFLMGSALRPERDYRTLAKVFIVAACCKAIMAVWIRHVLPESVVDSFGVWHEVEYATSHGDSLLFSCAALILVMPFFFRPTKRHLMWFAIIAPILVAGLIANDRRLAWVEISVGVILALVMNPRSWITRRLIRTVVVLSPILVVYVGLGWFSSSRIFGPVKTFRSIVSPQRSDGSIDRSTLFRDVENYNLIYTFTRSPLIGKGFGHAFDTPVANDDMSGFKEYPFLPHNSLLGLMGFAGGIGILGLLAPLVVGLFLAARASGMALTPDQSMAAAIVIGNIAAFIMHMWGDIGFTEPTAIFTVGAALAISGQLAVSTGAWRLGRVPGVPTPWRA